MESKWYELNGQPVLLCEEKSEEVILYGYDLERVNKNYFKEFAKRLN